VIAPAPAATGISDDADMVGEDEIIETEDEVLAAEGSVTIGTGLRKGAGNAPNKKAHQG
jgi:hypothetical protein